MVSGATIRSGVVGALGFGFLIIVATMCAQPAGAAVSAPAPAPSVSVTVPGGSADLQQYGTVDAYVALRNESTTLISVDELGTFSPAAVHVCPAFRADGSPTSTGSCASVDAGLVRGLAVRVAPGDTIVLRFTLHLGDQIEEGPATVLFQAHYRDVSGAPHTTDPASYTVTVSALGTSGLLDALKVPSFLFLPGFLIILVLYWLSGVRRTRPALIDQLGPGNVQSYAIGVLLSFAAIPLYPVVTSWFGPPRSYLAGYGLRDLVYVWVGSIVVGVVLALLYLGGDLLFRSRVDLYLEHRTPRVGDDPVAVLRKVGVWPRWWHGGVPPHRGLWFTQVKTTLGGETLQLLRLAEVAGTPPETWVAPPIEMSRASLTADRWQNVRDAMNNDDVAGLVEALESTPAAVRWTNVGFDWPQLVPASTLTTRPGLAPRRIVQEA